MYDIITIGSATRDVFLRAEGFELRKHEDSPSGVEQCFPLGSKIEVKEITFTTGGGGTNAAVTFARQGLKTACIGSVADDINGKEILEELKKEKVETKFFQKNASGHTAYSVIFIHPNAERTILSYKGEGQNLNAEETLFKKIKTKWLFLNSLGGNYELLEKAVLWAKENSVKIASNPGGKELAYGLEKLKVLLENGDIIIMNQEEAARLAGVNYENESEIFQAMDKVVKGIFVMTKGHEGVAVSDGKNIYKAGVPDSPIVERTGAGDAFSSGFVSEFIRSGDVAKAIQLATANASSVVTKVGSKAGILKEGDWGPWPLVEVKTNF
ncbi:MAG: carbohydrate kinase family protein [Candidatus Yanofskybacteria bacterium]|nr:carbohydrate kinase family protein [Candidatus Yanofskybacteria bacterium]